MANLFQTPLSIGANPITAIICFLARLCAGEKTRLNGCKACPVRRGCASKLRSSACTSAAWDAPCWSGRSMRHRSNHHNHEDDMNTEELVQGRKEVCQWAYGSGGFLLRWSLSPVSSQG